jgi:two-component system, OmpR family, sensor histidine kinase KdpD
MIRASGDIDIYVVTGDKTDSNTRVRLLSAAPVQHSSWRRYMVALPWLNYQAVGLTELFAVLVIAVYLGRGPALLAAATSAISWNYLFIEPRLTFEISQLQDVILFMLYFAIAIFTGNLTAKIRAQEQQARHNADRTMALYTLAHETASAVNMDDVLRTAANQIGQAFRAEVAILLPESGKLLAKPHLSSTLRLDEKEFSVAAWVFDNGKPAGRFTDTLPLAEAKYLPLLTPRDTVGVLGIRTQEAGRLAFDQEVMLETFANQIALVIERELLDEAAEQSAMLQESERLYTTLLNSISHELRTPIAAITGATSSLLDPHTNENGDARTALTRNIQDAAERLNRLVENLLDMSRLDSGRLKLKHEWCDVSDVIGVAVNRMEKRLEGFPLTMDITPGLPLVSMDFVLMEQVIVNLLDNIASYTPIGSSVNITAKAEGGYLSMIISDSGPGIPPTDLKRIFEKFYRVPGTLTGGTGLGLSICRGLVEAHGGTLTAENIPTGGTRFIIRLPIGEPPPPVREAAL